MGRPLHKTQVERPTAEHQQLLHFVFSLLNGVVAFSRINQQRSRFKNDLQQLKSLLLLRFQQAVRA
jgi:hypothetical protein